jgi:hypothetical protein
MENGKWNRSTRTGQPQHHYSPVPINDAIALKFPTAERLSV